MKTLIVIKPDGVMRGLVGEIISRFEKCGFKIKALKITKLDRETTKRLYAVHKGKNFFDELIDLVLVPARGDLLQWLWHLDDEPYGTRILTYSAACALIEVYLHLAVFDFHHLYGASLDTLAATRAPIQIDHRFHHNDIPFY